MMGQSEGERIGDCFGQALLVQSKTKGNTCHAWMWGSRPRCLGSNDFSIAPFHQ